MISAAYYTPLFLLGKSSGINRNTATRLRMAVELLVQEISGENGWHCRIGKIFDIAGKDITGLISLGYNIDHRVLKIRHCPREGGVYIHSLHIGKTHKLSEPLNLFLGLLHRPKGFAQNIENIGGGGYGDQALIIVLNGLSQRLVRIYEEGFPLLQDV